MRRPRAQSIYIMRCDGKVKVGLSSNTARRRNSLSTGSHAPVECVYEKKLPLGTEAMTEAAVHDVLKSCRLNGEWFSCQATTAFHAIDAVCGGDTTLHQAKALVIYDTDYESLPMAARLALRKEVETFLRPIAGDLYWL